MNLNKLSQLKQYIEAADLALQQAREVLVELGGDKIADKTAASQAKKLTSITDENSNLKIIEGVFNGQNMVGPDGKEYSIPVNYASKSKLVEGDILKLTIQEDGTFIYKQIKPVERERLKGEVVKDEVMDRYAVLTTDARKFNILTASVTYFKGEVGDQAIILIPKDKTAQWAAVENIMKKEDQPRAEKRAPAPQPELIAWDEEKLAAKVDDIKPSVLETEEANLSPVSYQGITQHVSQEPVVLLHNEETKDKDEEDLINKRREQERQKERQKIEQMINEEKIGTDDLEDWEDL